MSKTPKTDAVYKAATELPWGSAVAVPKGYPPSDPWKCARDLEQSLNRLRKELQNCVNQLEKAKLYYSCSGYDECIESANRTLYETLIL